MKPIQPTVICGSVQTVGQLAKALKVLPQNAPLSFDGSVNFISLDWILGAGGEDVVSVRPSSWCRE